MSKFLRNSLIIVSIIPLVIVLGYFGILPTPLNDLVAISGLIFLSFLVVIAIMLLGLYDALCGFMAKTKQLKKYKEIDPTICQRVVKDGIDGADFLISGPQEETFGHACREHWQFVKTDKQSSWIVKDERGNDITNSPLESYDSIAIIVGTYGPEYSTGESESDIPSEYTSIEDGTEFYD